MCIISKLNQFQSSDLNKIQLIDLQKEDASLIWSEILLCSQLQEINLTSCVLNSIPVDGFDQLNKLRILRFDNCSIESLPISAKFIVNLEILSLENNMIKHLPEYFNSNLFHKLTYLNLAHNELTVFPEKLGPNALSGIRAIHLHSNQIKNFPEKIDGIHNIKSFIASSNLLDKFPLCLKGIKSLEILYLAHNYIQEIPFWVSDYSGLVELNISGNIIGNHGFSNLTEIESLSYLEVYECGIENIGEEISNLKRLKQLDLTGNLLKSLPENIGRLNQLESLRLGYNDLRALPTSLFELTNLSELILDGNSNLSYSVKQELITHFGDSVSF